MKIGSLFSGIGGLEMGLQAALDAEVAWQVEIDSFCRSVLQKHWPNADRSVFDVRKATSDNLEKVDLICGGFPCQDICAANPNNKGLQGEKSALWFEMFRIIRDLRPRFVVLENVPAITIHSLGTILRQLAEIRYDAEWGVLSARSMGAPHIRKRWFLIGYDADNHSLRLGQPRRRKEGQGGISSAAKSSEYGKAERMARFPIKGSDWWLTERELDRVVDGVPNWTHRIRALGNSVMPACAYEVGQRLINRITEE